MTRKIIGAGVSVLLVAWVALAMTGLHRERPFEVAKRAATNVAREPLSFRGGRYEFRLVYSVMQARFTTPNAEQVRVEMTHVPLRGWSISKFERTATPG